MRNLKDYIMVLDDVLSPEFCTNLIQEFEQDEFTIASQTHWARDYRSFAETNLINSNSMNDSYKQFIDPFYSIAEECYNFYQKHLNIPFFPPDMAFEDARMKKYDNNDLDQFGWHTDVGDFSSARRYLVMFFYLNTVEEGGETFFNDILDTENSLIVRPKQGRLVMFPPMWMYPHKGSKPISEPKYILSTYAHYLGGVY